MNPDDFFQIADYLTNLQQVSNLSENILIRTAINRLYYGIFHLVQKELHIFIPQSEIHRCHAYVKEQIEDTKIRNDYSDLEEFRVDVDYNMLKIMKKYQYNDAKRIQQRILNRISEPTILYDADDEFFQKNK